MPSIEHHGASIYYEESGRGFPILTFAPAGLQSTIEVWSRPAAPVNPITEFAPDFRVIAMDQRNAGGRSRGPISAQDGWHTYAADHIAVLDHLRIDRCHLYGQCIGGSFIMSLLKAQPQRIASAVLAQPIGRVGAMAPGRAARFNAWAETLSSGRVPPEPVRRGLRLQRGSGVRRKLPDALPGAGGERRGASVPDLRGSRQAAAQVRVHPRVETGHAPGGGASPDQGVPGEAHARTLIALRLVGPGCAR